MKSVTAEFVDSQRQPDAVGVRVVEYKKRLWSESTKTFVWEDNWSILDNALVTSITPVVNQLDTDILNEFKVSNLSLNLNNNFGYFNFDNPDGFFGMDDASPNHDYEPYWTKFRIRSGYNLLDGSREYAVMFIGLAEEYTFESENKTVQLTLQGLETILVNSRAEGIATVVTEENAGSGNGVTVDFETDNPGVGAITLVSIDGISQVEGEDYTVSQINEATLPGKVTFTNPPDLGEVVRISYYFWPQSLQFHELVESLLESAGITNYLVEPIIFENSVVNTQTFTSQADWDSGTKALVDTAAIPNSMKLDWTDNALATLTTYSQATTGWSQTNYGGFSLGNWTSDGTNLIGATGTKILYRSIDRSRGIFEFKVKMTSVAVPNTDFLYFKFGNTSLPTPGSDFGSISYYQNGTNFVIGGTSTGVAKDTNYHTIRIVATGSISAFGSSNMDVYFDGNYVRTLSGQNGDLLYMYRNSSGVVMNFLVKEIYIPTEAVQFLWTSPIIDMLSTPTGFGSLTHNETLGFGSYVEYVFYETRTSADGLSWDPWIEITLGPDTVNSTKRRYIQVRARVEVSMTNMGGDFQIDNIGLEWFTDSTAVTLPAFSGINVYEAIQKMGEFTNYEFGFDSEESFFFRPKTVGSSVMSLSENDYNCKITAMDSGYARLYGTVRASYGDIVREVTDNGDFPSSPNARVTDKRFEISPDSAIQIAPFVDIASGIAKGLFLYFSKRRRRFKLATRFLPQLELSDVVTVRLINNNAPKAWYLGDDNFDLGDETITMWGEKNQLAFGMLAKIIALRHDTEKFASEFDLEEVV